MLSLQKLVAQQLVAHGLTMGDFVLGRTVPGMRRAKHWDVTYSFRKRVHLAISCGSIASGPGDSLSDLVGETMGACIDAHQFDPGIVLGCLVVDERMGGTQNSGAVDTSGFPTLGQQLASLSGRRSLQDAPELFEAATLLRVDFASRPIGVECYPGTLGWDEFFERLVDQVKDRNPTLRNRLDAI